MRRRFWISGIVQGVGFRWFVQRHARSMNLEGWVRNRPDGRVEVCARGRASELVELEEILWQGPPGSRVTGVDCADDEGADLDLDEAGFHIR